MTKVVFCAEKQEKQKKIPFSVRKRVQNSKSISFLKTLDVKYIEIPPLFFTSTHFERIDAETESRPKIARAALAAPKARTRENGKDFVHE